MAFGIDRALIEVSGPDARSFLQGLLTQDLDRLDSERVQYAALLTPQGKVVTDMFVWPLRDGAILDVDPARAAELMRRLTMYKLRSLVNLADAGDRFGVAVTEPNSDWPPPDQGQWSEPDPRFKRFPGGLMGGRILLDVETSYPTFNDATYRGWQIAAGVPDLAVDTQPEEVFALEGLLEELNGVDFHKGCFVGQENVSRMKRRATTRKKFCPIVFDGPAPAYGSAIRAGEAEIGSVRSGVEGRALALIRLDRALEAHANGVNLEAGGKPVRLDPPPWLILPSEASA